MSRITISCVRTYCNIYIYIYASTMPYRRHRILSFHVRPLLTTDQNNKLEKSLSGVIYLFIYLFIYFSHFKPLPFRGTSPWSLGINPSFPGTRLAFWSRGLGQHSRTAPTLDKHPVDYVVYSCSHAFHGGIQTTKKTPTHLDSNPRLSHPKGNSGTPTPPGRGGH